MTASSRTVIALLVTFVAALAAPAAAQDLSLGYQVQHFGSQGDGLTVPLGVHVSVAGPSSRVLSAVGQFDWSRKHLSDSVGSTSFEATTNFTTFAGGVRVSGRNNPSVTPFVEALFGVMRSSGSARIAGEAIGGASESNPLLQLGLGAAVPMSGALGVFGQVDYRRIFVEGEGVNNVRFVVGIRVSAR